MMSNFYKENVDYSFIIKEDKFFVDVKILKGKYKNIVVGYGNVSFETKSEQLGVELPEDEDEMYINFEYEVFDYANFDKETLKNDKNLQAFLGEVLVSIMIKQKPDELGIIKQNENR